MAEIVATNVVASQPPNSDQLQCHRSCQQTKLNLSLARAAALQSVADRRSTGNDVVATISAIIFFFFFSFFFSVATFSHRRNARIKKLIQRKWLEMANNLGLDPFPDPIGHFGAPWRPFWIFQDLLEGMMESKNLFSES